VEFLGNAGIGGLWERGGCRRRPLLDLALCTRQGLGLGFVGLQLAEVDVLNGVRYKLQLGLRMNHKAYRIRTLTHGGRDDEGTGHRRLPGCRSGENGALYLVVNCCAPVSQLEKGGIPKLSETGSTL
jgi:hypothetical protein